MRELLIAMLAMKPPAPIEPRLGSIAQARSSVLLAIAVELLPPSCEGHYMTADEDDRVCCSCGRLPLRPGEQPAWA